MFNLIFFSFARSLLCPQIMCLRLAVRNKRSSQPGFAQKGYERAVFVHCVREGWWAGQDSNLQPDRYERPALTVELPAPAGLDRGRVLACAAGPLEYPPFNPKRKIRGRPTVISHGLWHNTGKRALNVFYGAKQWPRQAHAHARNRLPRFPLAWNPAIEQEWQNIHKLGQVLVEKVRPHFITVCFNAAPFSPKCAAACAGAC
jgi:hypothetical protein